MADCIDFPLYILPYYLPVGRVLGVCKYWFFKASIYDWAQVLEWSVIQASSGDIPLITPPNATRIKIEGPINTCLTAPTRPMTCDTMRYSEAWIIIWLCRDSWCREVHIQLREKCVANLARWLLRCHVPSWEINSCELYSSFRHTQMYYFLHRQSLCLWQTAGCVFCLNHCALLRFGHLVMVGYIMTDWHAAVLYDICFLEDLVSLSALIKEEFNITLLS